MRRRLLPLLAAWALMMSGAATGPAFAQESEQTPQAEEALETGDTPHLESGGDTPADQPPSDQEPAGADAVDTGLTDIELPAATGPASDEPVLGPGGRPLRTDYPGTEEALQPRMNTARIEGLPLEDGQRPEDIYDLRVRELETKIDDLKERVFRSKSRIVLLKETVLSGNLAGSRVVIKYETKLGSVYKVRRALFSLDGNRIFNQIDRDGDLSGQRKLDIHSGSITPGTHTVSIMLGLQGSGYGLFSYVKGYEFNLRSSCQFTAEEGKTTLLTIVAYEKGNAFTAHEDRPDIVCHVSMVDLTSEDIEAMKQPTASGPSLD